MDALNDFVLILENFLVLNNKHKQSEFLKKYFIGQAASKLTQKRYEFSELLVFLFLIFLFHTYFLFFIFCFMTKTYEKKQISFSIRKKDLSEKIRYVCLKLLIVVTEILKTTTVNNNDKMDSVDENVCTSILYSILNSDSNFHHQCLREYYISPFYLNKKRLHMSKWRQELTIGSKLDCLKYENDWYSCTVIGCKKKTNEVHIHYFGFEDKRDEWVARDNPRLQPFKSVANGNRELGPVRKPMTSVIEKNFRKYEVDDEDEDDHKGTKKFGRFRGVLSQNISFRLVEAMNVFGENNGFNLLLKKLPLMKNMRNIRCIITVLEKVCDHYPAFFFRSLHLSYYIIIFYKPISPLLAFGFIAVDVCFRGCSYLAHSLQHFVMNTYHCCVIAW